MHHLSANPASLQPGLHIAVGPGKISGVESNRTASSTRCGAPPPIPLSFSLAAVLPRWLASRLPYGTDHGRTVADT